MSTSSASARSRRSRRPSSSQGSLHTIAVSTSEWGRGSRRAMEPSTIHEGGESSVSSPWKVTSLRRSASTMAASRFPTCRAGAPAALSSTNVGLSSCAAVRSAGTVSALSICDRIRRGLRISAEAKSTARRIPAGAPWLSRTTRWCTPRSIIRRERRGLRELLADAQRRERRQLPDRRCRERTRRWRPASGSRGR